MNVGKRTNPNSPPPYKNKPFTPMSDTIPPLRSAQFQNNIVASRPIPPGQFASLDDLKHWALELFRKVKRAPWKEENLLVFAASRQMLTWTLLKDDAGFMETMSLDNVIFFFTFAITVDENVSRESLAKPCQGFFFKSFVSALRATGASIEEWPVDLADADSDGRKLFKSILVTLFASGNAIIYEEIQANPQFTRALLRIIADAKTDPKARLKICRLALIGTPPSVLSPDAVNFAVDERNKIDATITVGPLTIKSFILVIEEVIGFLPSWELILLWTITGGIARHLQTLLGAIAISYRSKENTSRSFLAPQYKAIKMWLQRHTNTMTTELKSVEWQLLRNMVNMQSQGAKTEPTAIIDSLYSKCVIRPLYADLAETEIASYTINYSYIRAIAQYLTMMNESPKKLATNLCGFGLEDFVEKLLIECRREADNAWSDDEDEDEEQDEMEDLQGPISTTDDRMQWVPDAQKLAAAQIVSLSYNDFDIDLVLIKKATTGNGFHILLGSFKLNKKGMSRTIIQAFWKNNVSKFLESKVPNYMEVRSLHVIGMTLGVHLDNSSQIRQNWTSAAEEFGKTVDIPCSGDLWSFEEILAPMRNVGFDNLPFPKIDKEVLKAWPQVGREEDATEALDLLRSGFSVLVRGYAGVGKTTMLREMVMPELEKEEVQVHYVDGYDLIQRNQSK